MDIENFNRITESVVPMYANAFAYEIPYNVDTIQ